jgi:2-oxoglutarate dehydrogenase E1 component
VINNQLGFTTNYLDGRSSTYCTDVAKVTRSPVFHVNADDAEAVVFAIKMAIEYRQIFHTDVFIDLLGYRKYGHNEGDEPRFTQPKLYETIASHPNPREIYKDKLLRKGSLEEGMAKEMEKEFKKTLQENLKQAKARENGKISASYVDTCDKMKRDLWHSFDPIPQTRVSKKKLMEIGEIVFGIPEGIKVFEKIEKLYADRLERLKKGKELDWAMGELLAYGTLVSENIPVRLSGQDSERGTFSHRHAVVYDTENEQEYYPLKNIRKNQAAFHIYNSHLSEFGVLGFEYGYACANPDGLVIWEAQFGDFCNEAQVIIDQFIASAEAKWNRTNGVVLFLPHGYEGQGPEHSSARIERFLNLCANDNRKVANCTTPANFFHLLRSHVKYPFRVPLVIFTPKSLLRHPQCISTLDEFTGESFRRVIDDESEPEKVKRVVFCSGKIYYELAEKKNEANREDTAIIRLEQLYPFPIKELNAVLKKYKLAKEHFWVQEEPANAGPMNFIRLKFDKVPLNFVSRRESPSPATGFYKQHVSEQKNLIEKAFA